MFIINEKKKTLPVFDTVNPRPNDTVVKTGVIVYFEQELIIRKCNHLPRD
jgi:hypothetical protein